MIPLGSWAKQKVEMNKTVNNMKERKFIFQNLDYWKDPPNIGNLLSGTSAYALPIARSNCVQP